MDENATPPAPNPAPEPPPSAQPAPFAPPPLRTPPPPRYQPAAYAAPAPRGGRGWKVFAIILCVLLVFVLIFNPLALLSDLAGGGGGFMAGHGSGPQLQEHWIENNHSQNRLVVVPVEGVITGQSMGRGGPTMIDVIQEQLRIAADDKRVKAVVLKVNSPGGEVLASDDIYNLIAKFQKDTGKPVVAAMGSLAASGGYYVSAPCQWIVANELTITGSIGVIMHGYNYRGLMDKIGLRPETFKSGKFKDMLSGERTESETPPEERAMVQGLIDETYQKFKGIVAEGRHHAHEKNKKDGKELAANWADFADGRVLSGKQALDLGLVDELGDYDDALNRTLEIAGIKDESANIVEYQPKHDFADLFKMFGRSDARGLKVDLGVEMPKLHAGNMYFLWQPFSR